jgi:hypothetical protein
VATDDLRASDAERDHVIDLLQRAVGQGMLDLDEFSERTDAVLSASTRSEVNAVLLDLPDLVPDEPRTTKTDVLVLRSMLSEVTRSGRWHVPTRVLITSRLGVTRLDFTQAVLAGPHVAIELAITGGVVELRIPRRATALTANVRVTGGRVVDRRTPPEHRLTEPRFVLGGRVLAGEVRIVRPSLFGFVRRALARQRRGRARSEATRS